MLNEINLPEHLPTKFEIIKKAKLILDRFVRPLVKFKKKGFQAA